MSDILELSFPLARLGDAIDALARKSRLAPRAVELPAALDTLATNGEEAQARWMDSAAAWIGVEAEPVECAYADVESTVRRAGPAVFRVPGGDAPRFLAVLRGGRSSLRLVGPDLEVHRVALDRVCEALTRHLEVPLAAEVD